MSCQHPTNSKNLNRKIVTKPILRIPKKIKISRNSLSAPPATQTTGMSMAQTQQTAQQQLYAQVGPGPNGPTQNGLQQQQLQLATQQPQPQSGQNQYHTPQQLQQQAHGIYASQQQMLNPGYQQTNQYQPHQTHYVISNSNPNLNIHQYSQQQQQQQQPQQQQQNAQNVGPQQQLPPMPPPHQNGGPIYVSAAQAQQPHGMTSSASSNSVVYASQQQLSAGPAHAVPPTQTQTQTSNLANGAAPPPPPPHAYGQLNGGMQESPYGQVPKPPPILAVNTNGGAPMPPPLNRMNSQTVGGPIPPPPPAFGYNGNAPPPPAPPAPPTIGGAAAPPPPPPPPAGGGLTAGAKDPQAELMGSLAAQLQQAKLKKKTPVPVAADTNGGNNAGGGNYGTIGRSTSGMASMMDEMAKTLARRRAQAEKKEPEPDAEVKQRPWEKSNTLPHKLGSSSNSSSNTSNSNSNNTSNSGGESPRPMRKRFGSASEETILKQVNGDGLSLALSGGDLDALKAEIVREMRQELQKFKQDIIEAIKSEFNRR